MSLEMKGANIYIFCEIYKPVYSRKPHISEDYTTNVYRLLARWSSFIKLSVNQPYYSQKGYWEGKGGGWRYFDNSKRE